MTDRLNKGSRVAAVDRADALTFEWGSIQWLVNDRLLADSRMTVGVCEIKPGRGNPRHFHPNSYEIASYAIGCVPFRRQG